MRTFRIFGAILTVCLGTSVVWAGNPTATPTITPTGTYSRTWTPSATATSTTTAATATVTSSPTVTSTATETPTGTINTATPTSTATLTSTATATATVTSTRTVTCTPTMTSTPGISLFQVDPEKLAAGPATIRWAFTSDMKHLQIKLFTSSFRMLKRFPMSLESHKLFYQTGTHELSWDGLDDRGRHLVTGRYYLFLSADQGKIKYTAESQVDQP